MMFFQLGKNEHFIFEEGELGTVAAQLMLICYRAGYKGATADRGVVVDEKSRSFEITAVSRIAAEYQASVGE
jgi:hypothetical protein